MDVNKRIDEILDDFRAEVEYEYEDANRARESYEIAKREANAELKALIKEVVTEVVGEDEIETGDKWTPEVAETLQNARMVAYGRNALRADIKQSLERILK